MIDPTEAPKGFVAYANNDPNCKGCGLAKSVNGSMQLPYCSLPGEAREAKCLSVYRKDQTTVKYRLVEAFP